MDEWEERRKLSDRRHKILLRLQRGVFVAMIALGMALSHTHDLDFGRGGLLGLLMGGGAVIVNNALFDAMAPWVWPDLEEDQ